MKKLILMIFIILVTAAPVQAAEIEPPQVPDVGEKYMPEDTESFSEGLWYIIKTAINAVNPSVIEAAGICLSLIGVVLLVSVLHNYSQNAQKVISLAGTVSVGVILLNPSGSLINLAVETVTELSQYGKLLLPVMTAALAAQGGVTSSAAMYTGTALFCSILTTLISKLIVPLIYIYLCLSVANTATGEEVLKSIKDFIKWLITWSMKTILYVFSGYMGITKIVSGSVDASTLRATKLTISGMIPVVGKLISDASETILVSAGIVKNTVGIYGLLAILSVIIGPFLKIGIQYLLLKLTGSVCTVFGSKQPVVLIQDFAKAMAMLLGMIGIIGLMLMISTVCFMKGVA